MLDEKLIEVWTEIENLLERVRRLEGQVKSQEALIVSLKNTLGIEEETTVPAAIPKPTHSGSRAIN